MNVISRIGRGGSAYSWKYFLKCCLCEVFSSCFICTNIAPAERETMFGNRGKRNHCEIAFIFTYLISEIAKEDSLFLRGVIVLLVFVYLNDHQHGCDQNNFQRFDH